ncbi:MAG: PAS domain S-box protein, partial [Chloroflexota bacterium]
MNTARILIVEDDAILVTHLEQTLIQIGYQVSGRAATGEAAVEMALAQKPDAILMDIRLRSAMTGIQAAAEIHQKLDTPIIYLTAFTDDDLLQQAKLTDAYAYLAKPVRDRELRASLEMALYKHVTEQRLQHLNQILRAVRDVNKLITHELDAQRLLDQACQILLRTRGFRFVWVGQAADDRLKPLAYAGEGQALLTHIVASATHEQGLQLPGTQAARTRRMVVCHDMRQDERYAPWREEVEQVYFSSTVAVPILHEERLFGVLSVYSDKTNIFGPEELDLLLELAGDIAFGLKAIERETERKQAEEELFKFKLGFERSADAIFMTDPQGVILYTNPAFEQIYGYNQSDTIGQTPKILKSGVLLAKQYQQFWETLLNKGIVAGEIINKTKDGRLITIEGSNNPILDTAGNIIGFLGMHRDISERKQAERAIRESEERFRILLQDVQSVSVQGYSMDGITQYWNKASENLYGYSMEEAIGKNLIDLIVPVEMKGDVWKAISYMMESGQPIPASELTLMKKDGSPVTVYSSHAIVKGPGGVAELFCID